METIQQNHSQSLLRGSIYLVFSVVLTALTAILGGPFLYRLFQENGRAFYWASGLIISSILVVAGQIPLALCLFAVLVVIGLISLIESINENEEVLINQLNKKLASNKLESNVFKTMNSKNGNIIGLFSASVLAVLGSFVLTSLGVFIWKSVKGVSISETLTVYINKQLEVASKLATFENMQLLNVETIINIFPSLIFSLLFLCLAVTFMGKELSKSGFKNKNFMISQYKVPAFFVVALSAAALLFVLSKENQAYRFLGLNALIIIGTFYFIQGLAVFTALMKTFKMGFFWQLLIYFLIFSQLLFVCLIGFADFWLDFRQKIYKKLNKKKSDIKD